MKKMPLQCGRMASVAQEYCALIDGDRGAGWVKRLVKLLPRLHVAVTALPEPSDVGRAALSYDDEKRCEMFLDLSNNLQADHALCSAYIAMSVGSRRRQQLCERMADNLADIYFDLKQGLEVLPNNPQRASEVWQYSFYVHWGKHLMDAECWLRAVESGSEFISLPEWHWPNNVDGLIANPA